MLEMRVESAMAGLFHSTMSPILERASFLSLSFTLWCMRLDFSTSFIPSSLSTLKLTVANSYGICGVCAKNTKKIAWACISKRHQAFTAFLPKNFSTFVIVRRHSFPFLLWLFLSLLIFLFSFSLLPSLFLHLMEIKI